MNDSNESIRGASDASQQGLKPLWFYVTGAVSYLLFGAICAFIAFDNNMITKYDTPAELAQHTHELKVVLTSSFIGGGLLGAIFGVGGLWILKKGNSSNRGIDSEDKVA